ncbi:hypothetical protein LX32DRAFT_637555, partial [Colletotrichum zoysiae]
MAALRFFLLTFLCALAQGTVVITYDTSTTCAGALYRTFNVNPLDCVPFPGGYRASSAEIADHRPLPLRLRVWTYQGANLCAAPVGTGDAWGSCVTSQYQEQHVISGLSLVPAQNNFATPEEALPHDHTDSTSATPLTYGYVDVQVVYELSAESPYGQEYAKLQNTQDKISFLKKHGDKHADISAWTTDEGSQLEL